MLVLVGSVVIVVVCLSVVVSVVVIVVVSIGRLDVFSLVLTIHEVDCELVVKVVNGLVGVGALVVVVSLLLFNVVQLVAPVVLSLVVTKMVGSVGAVVQ